MSNEGKKETHGDQAPIVDTGGGDSTIKYGDKVVGDKVGGDKVGGDKVGGDKVGGDKVGGDKIVHVKKNNFIIGVIIVVLSVAVAWLSWKFVLDDLFNPEEEVKILELKDEIKQQLLLFKDSEFQTINSYWGKDNKEAEKLLREFYDNSESKDASLEFILGNMRLLDLDYEGAMIEFKKATGNNPDNDEYWNRLGLVYLKLAEQNLLTDKPNNTAINLDSNCDPLKAGVVPLETTVNIALAYDSNCKALNLRKIQLNATPDNIDAKLARVESVYNLGWASYLMDEKAKAERFYDESLKLSEGIYKEQENAKTVMAVAKSYLGRGNAKASSGNHAEAGKDYTAALEIITDHFPTDEDKSLPILKLNANIQSTLATAIWYGEETDFLVNAIEAFKTALGLYKFWAHRLDRNPRIEDHRLVAWTYYNLGSVYEQKGDIKDAKKYFNESKDMFERLPGTDIELLCEIEIIITSLDEDPDYSEIEGCE